MEFSLKCRKIVIFSLHEIILWFTHYFESYPCGKSDCNFFWDIWYIHVWGYWNFWLMPSLHLLRSSYDGLVYDFSLWFGGHRRWLRATICMFTLFTVIVRISYDLTISVRCFFAPLLKKKIVRSLHDQRKASARWPCARTMPPTMCLRATILRFWKICITPRYTKS